MAEHDGSVIIEIDANDQKAEKKLEALKKKAEQITESVSGEKTITFSVNVSDAEKKLKQFQNNIEKATETKQLNDIYIKSIQQQMEAIVGERQAAIDKNDSARVKQLEADYDALATKLRRYIDSTKDADTEIDFYTQKLQAMADAIKRAAAEQEAAKQAAAAAAEQAEGTEQAAQASDRLKTILESLKESASSVASATASAFKSVASGIGGVIKNAASGIASFAKNAASSMLSLAKNAMGVLKNLNVFSKLTDSLSGKFKRLGSMIKRAFVFSVIRKGLTEIKNGITSYLSTNEEFTSALSRVKGALLTAFQPIYEAVLPALTSLMNGLTKVIAVIAQFISALFGKTAKQSQQNAKALNEQAKALEATGSAADDAGKSMASFDEINQLTNKTSGGGGGAAGTDTAAPSFDFEADTTVFDSWGAAFSALLDKILNDGIPKLREGLLNFADWLNDFSTKLYDMFKFDGVAEKVAQIGIDLANAFNDLTNRIDWAKLGAALGAGLQLALSFLVNFIWTYDWKNLGASVATLINNAVYEIDWYNVGQILWAGFKIAIEFLAGLLETLDMAALANAASELIIGFFDSITETIQKIDWYKIGEQIRDFLVNIDWEGVVESVAEAIGSAIGAGFLLILGFIEEAWNDIVDWWYETAYEDGEFTISGLIDGMWEAIKDIGRWIKEHIFDPIVGAITNMFGISGDSSSSVFKGFGASLINGLYSGITSLIGSVVGIMNEIVNGIKSIFNGLIEFVTGVFSGDWSKAWDGISEVFKGVWNGIVGTLEGAVNLIISGINWLINQLNKVSFSVPDWVPAIGGKSFGFDIPNISEISIPRLATGAVIPANHEFLARLGDQKSGTNIETPLSTMVQAFKQALSESGGGSRTIVMEVGGREFGRVSFDLYNQEATRRGVKLGVK